MPGPLAGRFLPGCLCSQKERKSTDTLSMNLGKSIHSKMLIGKFTSRIKIFSIPQLLKNSYKFT